MRHLSVSSLIKTGSGILIVAVIGLVSISAAQITRADGETDQFFFENVTYDDFAVHVGKVKVVGRLRGYDDFANNPTFDIDADYKPAGEAWQDLTPDESTVFPNSWDGDNTFNHASIDSFDATNNVEVKLTNLTNSDEIETMLTPAGAQEITLRRQSTGPGEAAGETMILLAANYQNNSTDSRAIRLEYFSIADQQWHLFAHGAPNTTTPDDSTGIRAAFDSVPCSIAYPTTENDGTRKSNIIYAGRLLENSDPSSTEIDKIEGTFDVTAQCPPPTPTPTPTPTPSGTPSPTPTPSATPSPTPSPSPTPTSTPTPTPTPSGTPSPTPTP